MELIFSLKKSMSIVSDPRMLGRTKHYLIDILVLSVLAIIGAGETWNDIEHFGKAKQDWLKKFLRLPNGIPSHDTISRVFSLIQPIEFEKAFINWVNEVRTKVRQDTICIDGKTSRGTVKKHLGRRTDCLHVVSAWSTEQRLVLGQLKAEGSGSAEVPAARELIDLLDIEGMVIVGDAGIGRSSVVNKIVEKKGNYIFPLKKNSRKMYPRFEKLFSNIPEKNSRSQKVETYVVKEQGHGRKEERSYTIIRKDNLDSAFNEAPNGKEYFKNLNAIGRVVYESEEKENRPMIQEGHLQNNKRVSEYYAPKELVRKKKEVRYFFTSLNTPIEDIAEKMRLQWAIENQLHWVLDVSLGEDGNRTRNKIAAENMSVIRKIAINLAKQDKKNKVGVKSKLKMAAWDLNYMENLLFNSKLV